MIEEEDFNATKYFGIKGNKANYRTDGISSEWTRIANDYRRISSSSFLQQTHYENKGEEANWPLNELNNLRDYPYSNDMCTLSDSKLPDC